MLKRDRWPNSPLKGIAIISLFGIVSWVYASVAMFVLIMSMEQVCGVLSKRWLEE